MATKDEGIMRKSRTFLGNTTFELARNETNELKEMKPCQCACDVDIEMASEILTSRPTEAVDSNRTSNGAQCECTEEDGDSVTDRSTPERCNALMLAGTAAAGDAIEKAQ